MRAFTIIEILITFFILSLIAGSIFAVTNIAILSWDSNRGGLELVQEVRQAMDGMTREARQSNISLIITNYAYTMLNFSIPDIALPISYYIQNNQLIREHPTGTKQVLANNINDLNFYNISSTVLQIQINATKTIRNTPQSFSLVEEVKLRNE